MIPEPAIGLEVDAEPPSHPSPPNTHAHTPPVPSTIFPLAPPPPSLAHSLVHPSLASWLLKGTQDPDRHPPSPKYSRTAQPDPSPLLPTAAHLSTSASSLSSPYLFHTALSASLHSAGFLSVSSFRRAFLSPFLPSKEPSRQRSQPASRSRPSSTGSSSITRALAVPACSIHHATRRPATRGAGSLPVATTAARDFDSATALSPGSSIVLPILTCRHPDVLARRPQILATGIRTPHLNFAIVTRLAIRYAAEPRTCDDRQNTHDISRSHFLSSHRTHHGFLLASLTELGSIRRALHRASILHSYHRLSPPGRTLDARL